MHYTRLYLIGLGCVLLLSSIPATAQRQKKSKKKKSETQVTAPLIDAKQARIITLYCDATTQKIIGNTKEALSQYLEVVQLDPTNAAAMYEAASIYAKRKQFAAALELSEKAYHIAPHNKWYALLTADLQEITGNYK